MRSAAPYLFTFVNHPGIHMMDPTNNESERMLRPVAIRRKARYGMVSDVGTAVFSTPMACLVTWRKRNLNVSDMLHKAPIWT